MKRALFLLITGLAILSCGEDKATATSETPETPKVKSAVAVDPKLQQLEDLKKMPASGLDELQKMLPETIDGIKRSNFSMTSNMGYATVQADYKKNSKAAVHIVLYDCAGEQGAELFRNSFQSKLDSNEESEKGYSRTVTLGTGKAVEQFEAATNVTTLRFMANEKVLVMMAGKNIAAEKLLEAAQKM